MPKKLALIILDGFGVTNEQKGNAVLNANTPYFDELIKSRPNCLLRASSEEVGLPWGEAGNSEVGHTNIGLGRVVLQDLPQIDKVFEQGLFSQKENVVKARETLAANPGNVHIIFVASDGAVHGHIRHLKPIVKYFLEDTKANKIILHFIADGRDVDEKSITKYVATLNDIISDRVLIGSVSGRYFAMDRDKNYDRTAEAYRVIMGQGDRNYPTINEAIETSYQNNETDEFIKPSAIGTANKINPDNDLVLFTNFRSDRAIQLARAFCDQSLAQVNNGIVVKNFYSMTTYDDNLGANVIFSNIDLYDKEINPLTFSLCEILSKNNLSQAHIAETEKFAHITYFLSGGIKDPFSNQNNLVIPSDKVKSFDLAPKMKGAEITDGIIKFAKEQTNFIVANFANGDMVGHSGNYDKSVEAVEFLDICIKRAITSLLENGYSVILTADHGNCDEMIDLKNNKPSKEHSLNPVPFILIRENVDNSQIGQAKTLEFFSKEPIGVLADVAPTILEIFEIESPVEFSGISLTSSLT